MESVIFIPCTPRSALQRELQQAEDLFCTIHGTDKVRFVERGGTKLSQILRRKNPFGRVKCGRTGVGHVNTQNRRNGEGVAKKKYYTQ